MKKNCCEHIIDELLSRTGNYVRDKVKVVLDLSNYTTKKIKNMLQALIHLI